MHNAQKNGAPGDPTGGKADNTNPPTGGATQSGERLIEKPQNGWAGLKEVRWDLPAGLVVSLVSLPLSMGIAVASGMPPICGIISAIIAGLVVPFFGGSYVTISGPAAGLAPALLAGMLLLGHGNKEVGYPLLLVAICLTGALQIILAKFKLARFAAIFPANVVEGMLAAIGALIIVKQIPLIAGHPFHSHGFWGMVSESPALLAHANPRTLFVGLSSLALMFGLNAIKGKWKEKVPVQVIAAVYGLGLSLFMGLDPSQRVQIPAHPFSHGITLPNFAGAFADRSLWWNLLVTIVTLTLIDGVESLATIAAIDKIDPFHRRSDPNKTLNAMGVANVCSSLVGGATIIPGGVKSGTCVASGGRTQWANFYNALCLTFYLLAGRAVINLMPFATLGAIIVFTGYKLCKPSIWMHVSKIGKEQLLVFGMTVLMTVTEDLLIGIFAGMLTELLVMLYFARQYSESGTPQSIRATLYSFFKNPVERTDFQEDALTWHIRLRGHLTAFNHRCLTEALAAAPVKASVVKLHLRNVVIIDHTAGVELKTFAEEVLASGRTLTGYKRAIDLYLASKSGHPEGTRVRLSMTTPVPALVD